MANSPNIGLIPNPNPSRLTAWMNQIIRVLRRSKQAALPTTSQIPEGEWLIWNNTALTGDRRLWLADDGVSGLGGTTTVLYGIPFSMIERTTIPSTSDVERGGWVIWKNTTLSGGVAANTVKLWVNDNGTMKSVTLT